MDESNKEIFRSIFERDISNIYSQLKQTAFNIMPPSYKKIVQTIYSPKEQEIISWLQDQTDFIVDSCFLNPNTTIEEAINKSRVMIKDMLSGVLMEKLGISDITSNIIIQILLK